MSVWIGKECRPQSLITDLRNNQHPRGENDNKIQVTNKQPIRANIKIVRFPSQPETKTTAAAAATGRPVQQVVLEVLVQDGHRLVVSEAGGVQKNGQLAIDRRWRLRDVHVCPDQSVATRTRRLVNLQMQAAASHTNVEVEVNDRLLVEAEWAPNDRADHHPRRPVAAVAVAAANTVTEKKDIKRTWEERRKGELIPWMSTKSTEIRADDSKFTFESWISLFIRNIYNSDPVKKLFIVVDCSSAQPIESGLNIG